MPFGRLTQTAIRVGKGCPFPRDLQQEPLNGALNRSSYPKNPDPSKEREPLWMLPVSLVDPKRIRTNCTTLIPKDTLKSLNIKKPPGFVGCFVQLKNSQFTHLIQDSEVNNDFNI